MSRIQRYPDDPNIQGSDRLIGTDITGGRTKNFPIQELSEYFVRSGSTDISRDSFLYQLISLDFTSAAAPRGQVVYDVGGRRNAGYAHLTQVRISGLDITGREFAPAAEIFPGLVLNLVDLATNSYAYYNVIDASQEEDLDSFVLSLQYISSTGGLIRNTENHLISLTPTSIQAEILFATNGIITGLDDPNGNVNGETGAYYIQIDDITDPTTYDIFGPKTTGTEDTPTNDGWGTATRLNQVGPQGPQGERGERGIRGFQGERGERGEQGPPGMGGGGFVAGTYPITRVAGGPETITVNPDGTITTQLMTVTGGGGGAAGPIAICVNCNP